MLRLVSTLASQDSIFKDLQWSSNRRNTVHTSNDTHISRTLSERDRVGNNQNGTAKDSRSSQTGDGTANDQSSRVGRGSAYQAADLEDGEGDEVNPFDRVEGVEFAVDELRRARGEQVG
jgi:hypothetical protein